jgi:hypothetical protein
MLILTLTFYTLSVTGRLVSEFPWIHQAYKSQTVLARGCGTRLKPR